MSQPSAALLPLVHIAERCDRGLVRAENQDAVLSVHVPMGELLVVADGIGGYQGGAVASGLVTKSFHHSLAVLASGTNPEKALREAAEEANRAILAECDRPGSLTPQMGSTVVAVLLQRNASGSQAWVAHVGDSRACLIEDGRLIRLTRDHSAVQELVDLAMVRPEDARRHPEASVLTRSLGQSETVEVDLSCHPMEPGNTLLLCSDGLWGYVAPEQIQAAAGEAEGNLEVAAQALLNLALEAGGQDNIGFVLARLSAPPRPVPPKAMESLLPQPKKSTNSLLAMLLIFIFAVITLFGLGVDMQRLFSLFTGDPSAMMPFSVDETNEPPDSRAHTFALIYAEGAEQRELPRATGWTRAEIDPERSQSCREFAQVIHRITIYYEGAEPALADRFARHNLTPFGEHALDLDRRPMTPQLRSACGHYELIAFVPASSAVPGTQGKGRQASGRRAGR